MTTPVDLNEVHREFWKPRHAKIDELMKKRHLVATVARREAEKARFVKLATSEAVRVERIRNQKPFECELENAAEEFASLPLVEAQRRRAKKPRGKVGPDEETLNQVIEALVSRPEHRSSSAPELWSHLFAELDRLLLDPEEAIHPTDPRKSAYSYEFNSKRKTITYGRLATLVSEYRKKVTLAGRPKP